MPESLGGLALFVALLAPGFLYVWRRERRVPRASPSALRETAEVVLASVVGTIFALSGMAAVRATTPSITPDVGRLVREGGAYVKDDYRLVAVWAVGLLATACLSTFWAAGPKTRTVGLLGRFRPTDIGAGNGALISPASRWWEMFREEVEDDEQVWVQCTLEDGTYLAGALGSFSTETDETGDRDLVLVGPIDYGRPGEKDTRTLGDLSVIISASRIMYLGVAYLPVVAREPVRSNTVGATAPEGTLNLPS